MHKTSRPSLSCVADTYSIVDVVRESRHSLRNALSQNRTYQTVSVRMRTLGIGAVVILVAPLLLA